MKILKSNTNQVFDTENIDSIESYTGEKIRDVSKALHQNIDKTECQFLAGYFPIEHTIFDNFTNSYYWILEKITQMDNEEKSILIGHLNHVVYIPDGYKKTEIGTPVFLLKDEYFIELEPVNGGDTFRQFYNKEELKKLINFTKND